MAFELGDVSVGEISAGIMVFILIVTLFFASRLKVWLENHFQQFRHALDVDVRRYRFFIHFTWCLIVVIGVGVAIYFIPALRSVSVSIFAGAGVLAVIVGFAAQAALANVVSGLFIAVFKPYRVGDWIKVEEDFFGTVEDITLRHTVIRTPQNKRIVIPNSQMGAETVENWSIEDQRICQFVEQSVSLDADIDKALAIMQDEAEKHPKTIDARRQKEKDEGMPIVKANVVGFGDSSVRLRAWVWCPDPRSALDVGWDLSKSIKQRFDKDGIEVPFPYRTIVYKSDLERRARTRGRTSRPRSKRK